MAETEVTQALWYAVMGKRFERGSGTRGDAGVDVIDDDWKGSTLPACGPAYIHWQEFVAKLNELTGKTFRMPTEAEWEYAARGGKKSKGYIFSGSNSIEDVAWYGFGEIHAVKTKAANELGLYDMSGNVSEWCSDLYGTYGSSNETDPKGSSEGSLRVLRGGSISHELILGILEDEYASCCRVSYRRCCRQDVYGLYSGLRLASE